MPLLEEKQLGRGSILESSEIAQEGLDLFCYARRSTRNGKWRVVSDCWLMLLFPFSNRVSIGPSRLWPRDSVNRMGGVAPGLGLAGRGRGWVIDLGWDGRADGWVRECSLFFVHIRFTGPLLFFVEAVCVLACWPRGLSYIMCPGWVSWCLAREQRSGMKIEFKI